MMDGEGREEKEHERRLLPFERIKMPQPPAGQRLKSGRSYASPRSARLGKKVESARDYEVSKETMNSLRSVDDVISYFALHGSSTPLKFVHLNRAPTGKTYRPYDLIVTLKEELQSEHFTMSASGVVRVAPREPSEFMSLSEWMRYSSAFNSISAIPFFRNFLVGKAFQHWRSSIKFKLFTRQRERVQSKLFFAKTRFCSALMEIGQVVAEMHDIILIDLRCQKVFEMRQFTNVQTQRIAQASKEIDGFMDKMLSISEKVCNDTVTMANTSHAAFLRSMTVMNNSKEMKAKSLVALKEEKSNCMKALRIANQETRMLHRFVRLVDFITTEAWIKLCLNAYDRLLLEMTNTQRKSGLFEVVLSFDEKQQTIFSPSYSKVLLTLDSVIKATKHVIANVRRIISVRPFEKIVDASLSGVCSVSDHVDESTRFVKTLRRMEEIVKTDFKAASVYAKIFDPVKAIAVYGQENGFYTFKKRSNSSLPLIKREMNKLVSWKKDLEKMRVGNTIGILFVESRRLLKGTLAPIVHEGLERMKEWLSSVARDQCSIILTKLKQKLRMLESKPIDLNEFATFLRFLQDMSFESNELKQQGLVVDEMYRLCALHGMKIVPEDLVQFDDLKALLDQIDPSLKKAEGRVRDAMPEMTKILNAQIENHMNNMLQVRQAAMHGVLVNPESNLENALSEVRTLASQVEVFSKLCQQFSSFEDIFSVDPFDFRVLEELRTFSDCAHLSWVAKEHLQNSVSQWETCLVCELDLKEIEDVLRNITEQILGAKNLLPQNEVAIEIEGRLAKLQTCHELLKEVKGKENWAEVLAARVGMENLPLSFTFGELMKQISISC